MGRSGSKYKTNLQPGTKVKTITFLNSCFVSLISFFLGNPASVYTVIYLSIYIFIYLVPEEYSTRLSTSTSPPPPLLPPKTRKLLPAAFNQSEPSIGTGNNQSETSIQTPEPAVFRQNNTKSAVDCIS